MAGELKYLKYSDEIADSLKAVNKMDEVAEAAQGAGKLDEVADVGKGAGKADEAADAAQGAGKADEIAEGAGKLTADDITFSDKFSKPGYTTQVADRGWTNQSIADTINNPLKTGASVNKFTGNPVTVYYTDSIHYVAVDNVTGKVIQVANMADPNWVLDLLK